MKVKSKIIVLLSVIIIAVVLIVLMFFNDTKAIYTKQSNWNYVYDSSSIYIDSSLIKENAKYVYNNYDGSNISFSINNYLDDNLISSADIEYDLECSSDNQLISCIIDTGNNTLISSGKCYNGDDIVQLEKSECIKKDYQFVFDKKSYEHNVRVIKNNNDINSAEVDLFLKVKKPYTKEIKTSLLLNFTSNDENVINFGLRKVSNSACNYYISNKFNSSKKIILFTNNNFFLENNIITLDKESSNQFMLYKKNTDVNCDSNNLSYAIIDSNKNDEILSNLNFELGGNLLSGTYSSTSSYLDNKYYSIDISKNADISDVNLGLNIYLRIKSMDKELQSSLVHWYLTEVSNNSETLISKGNFANITSNGDIEILSNMPILTSNKRLYIRIWLEDNLLQNKNIDIFPYFKVSDIS